MTFAILHPHSNTNPSDKYRVVDTANWTRFANGVAKAYAFTAWDTYAEAERVRDEANRK